MAVFGRAQLELAVREIGDALPICSLPNRKRKPEPHAIAFLSVIIPALNEEEPIAGVDRRNLLREQN